ncbi:hypothetical protein EB796_005567 [Bugula neritina]|uniref:Uncharacterized protein n=1 Tax=Bugula neritina TaxID=10212 RepID=A0A7J7KBY9_BUGNE|nr:hypothetical protein EB796_005567 [Bugula neritina]
MCDIKSCNKSHVCGIKYIHVCHPLKAMKWCRIKIANKVCAGNSNRISSIITFQGFLSTTKFCRWLRRHRPVYRLLPHTANSLGANEIYKYSYAFGMYMAVMYALPWVPSLLQWQTH